MHPRARQSTWLIRHRPFTLIFSKKRELKNLFLLRSSLGVPRLLHVLRSSRVSVAPRVTVFDEAFKGLLVEDSNCSLSDNAWARASLPVRWGGLGVRSVSSLTVPTFLASSIASLTLVETLLPQVVLGHYSPVMAEAEASRVGRWWADYCSHAFAGGAEGSWLSLYIYIIIYIIYIYI